MEIAKGREWQIYHDEQLSPSKGPTIVDNIGIRREGILVNVEVNPNHVKTYILDTVRARCPSQFARSEKLVDGMTISFGAKPYPAVLSDVVARQRSGGLADEIRTRGTSFFSNLLRYEYPPLGQFFPDGENPYIYINTGRIRGERGFYETFDHEVNHFVQLLKSPNWLIIGDILKIISLSTGIDIALGLFFSYMSNFMKVVKEDERISRREFTRMVVRDMPYKALGQVIPACAAGTLIVEEFLSGREKEAQSLANTDTMDLDLFRNMLQIVKSS